MQLHQLKPNKRSKKKRIGRGGKRGTYSGRGVKGQKSRAGRKMQPSIRELIKRYHKLRGYRYSPLVKVVKLINLDVLEKNFQAGDKVSPGILLKKDLIGKIKNKIPPVKILAKGVIKKKLAIEGCLVSKAAKEAIEKAGGKIS